MAAFLPWSHDYILCDLILEISNVSECLFTACLMPVQVVKQSNWQNLPLAADKLFQYHILEASHLCAYAGLTRLMYKSCSSYSLIFSFTLKALPCLLIQSGRRPEGPPGRRQTLLGDHCCFSSICEEYKSPNICHGGTDIFYLQ